MARRAARTSQITRANLLAFLDRPWDELRLSKDRSSARTAAERGAGFMLRRADDMRRYYFSLGGTIPEEYRRDNLATAIRIDRSVFGRRPLAGRLVENACRLLSPVL